MIARIQQKLPAGDPILAKCQRELSREPVAFYDLVKCGFPGFEHAFYVGPAEPAVLAKGHVFLQLLEGRSSGLLRQGIQRSKGFLKAQTAVDYDHVID